MIIYSTKKFLVSGDEWHSSNTFYSSANLFTLLQIFLLFCHDQIKFCKVTTSVAAGPLVEHKYSMFTDLKASLLQVAIVLVPTYTVAYLTEMMVYTIPMLAASTILASSVRKREHTVDTDLDSDSSDSSQ